MELIPTFGNRVWIFVARSPFRANADGELEQNSAWVHLSESNKSCRKWVFDLKCSSWQSLSVLRTVRKCTAEGRLIAWMASTNFGRQWFSKWSDGPSQVLLPFHVDWQGSVSFVWSESTESLLAVSTSWQRKCASVHRFYHKILLMMKRTWQVHGLKMLISVDSGQCVSTTGGHGSGVDSGRIMGFSVGPAVNNLWKTGRGSGVTFQFQQ